jgi:hypothetical protein
MKCYFFLAVLFSSFAFSTKKENGEGLSPPAVLMTLN